VTGLSISQREGVAADRHLVARSRRRRVAGSVALAVFVGGNAVGVLWLWGAGGSDGIGYHWSSFDAALLSLGRMTALLAGYLALIEVLLLARLPFLERLVGFDRLTRWHRWNGHAVLYLILAHVVFSVWGYARIDKQSWFQEYWNWLTLPQPGAPSFGGAAQTGSLGLSSGSLGLSSGSTGTALAGATSPYPGIITATIGTALLIAVVVTSLVVVRRKLPYEWWYAIHFTAYAGIALAWFHMIPDGNEFVIDKVAADYWRSLYVLAVVLVLVFRVARPLVRAFRFDLRVTDVIEEGPGVVSLRIVGRGLDRLGARPGQFFFWRFLAGGFWYTQHPFSLSEAPKGDTFRITVKNLGDHTSKFGRIPVGTRVFCEGPFGVFTDEARVGDKALLIAGGIGITPVRALLEQMDGDVVALYRVVSSGEIVFSEELNRIAAERGARLQYVVGDHTTEDGRNLLSPAHLEELVPDIAERDVYICGPSGLVDNIVPNLRLADVPRRRLHVERFAL
jgi:predicted ferric reductase